jgi:hypothetical protein
MISLNRANTVCAAATDDNWSWPIIYRFPIGRDIVGSKRLEPSTNNDDIVFIL